MGVGFIQAMFDDASCGRFLSSSSGDDKRLLVVQPIVIEEVLLLDRANQQRFICPPPRATTDRWVTTEDPRPQALTSGSRGSEGWAEQGQGIYILLIGIRTLFDGVTRGYGDHSPLTRPEEEVTHGGRGR